MAVETTPHTLCGNRDGNAIDAGLCTALRDRGKLDQNGYDRIWRWHEETGQHINEIATSLGLVSERDMAQALASYFGLPLLESADYPEQPLFDDSTAINVAYLRDSRVLPLYESDDGIVLAMVDPRDDFAARSLGIKFGKPILPRVAVPTDLESAIERLYGEGKSSLAEIVDTIETDDGDFEDDAERLKRLASEAPVIRLVNILIARAVEGRASDIHIEPFDSRLRVRYRIDGVLHEVESPPNRLRNAIISRIKIIAKLNIAERRLPQDGRINLIVHGKEIDLRVSTIPGLHGESVVLRILDKSGGVIGLEDLGFDKDSMAKLLGLLEKPNGIMLVTGPTGSGKTTTLYAALTTLNSPDRKILTVEDPIEYQLYGINQIQVKPQIDLTFAATLRAFLRQDPDIIMIGEIRDLETAQIAAQASLTGHLVLSTLHTNSAAATVTRLLDMGIEDYLLAATLTGVVAQRLVRVLCSRCKETQAVAPKLADELGLTRLASGSNATVSAPVGCDHCQGSGYRGRQCIVEILPIDETIKAAVANNEPTHRLQELATLGGMRTLYEDGLHKVLGGITSIEEVLRVTSDQPA